jgi:hypothetical protein
VIGLVWFGLVWFGLEGLSFNASAIRNLIFRLPNIDDVAARAHILM